MGGVKWCVKIILHLLRNHIITRILMSIKTILLTAILFLFCSALSAQAPIKGTVLDTANNPIVGATIVLVQQADSSFITGTVTDTLGVYDLGLVQESACVLRVSSIGYKTSECTLQNNLKIYLSPDTFLLNEITLAHKRPIATMTSDGVQTSVAHTVLEDVGSGNDVLKRVPMLSGDDGVYEVLGRGAAQIYINGREVRDPSEIERLSSKDIKNVEVVTSPGAKYDASVPAVINITTTRKQGDGFGVNARTSFYTWEMQNYVNNVDVNYRYKGLDVSAGVDYINKSGYQRSDMTQEVSVDTLWMQKNRQDGDWQMDHVKANVGLNWIINDRHQLGGKYDIEASRDIRDMRFVTTSDVMANGILVDKWNNEWIEREVYRPTHKANVYYSGRVGKFSIDFNADYLGSGSTKNTLNLEKSTLYGDRELRSTNIVSNSLWAAKLELAYPIWKGQLMAGVEYVNIRRVDDYENPDMPDFSSGVDVKENNVAAYAQYAAQTKYGSFAVGLRYENADYEYLVEGVRDPSMSKVYHQWFPNASYSIQLKDFGLQLAYTSKVERPTYRMLSNNMFYANRFTIQRGNPYLKPVITHNVSVMGVWKFLQASVAYSNMQDKMENWIEGYDKDPKVSLITYRGIDDAHTLTAFVALAPQIKWWRPQWSVGMTKIWIDEEKLGLEEGAGTPVFFANWSNMLTLLYDININLDLSYQSAARWMFARINNHKAIVNFAISKSFLEKSLQLKLGINDIFNQEVSDVTILVPQRELWQRSEYVSRQAYITLRYSFNQADGKWRGKTAGEDAMKRL